MELQRPYARHDRARNRAFAAGRRTAGREVRGHRRRPRSRRAPGPSCRTRSWRSRHHATLDASEPLRRGNHSHVMSTPQAMASRFADHPEAVRETLALAERLTFDLSKDLGYRYPGAEEQRRPRAAWPSCAARAWMSATDRDRARPPAGRARRRAEAQARLEQELRVIEQLGLAGFFLLHHDMLELAREVAREVRGPDSRARAAGARTRARILGLLAGVLPDRPLPHRSDREQAGAGALPARGPARAARHRPGLPPRHPRAADPARARALRQRSRGAGGGLPDLSRARRDPRAGQGPRPAGRRDRARGTRRRLPAGPASQSTTSPPRSPARTGGPPVRRGQARWAGERGLHPSAGAGWPGWSSRPMACRGISPSTPAGWSSRPGR